MKIPNSKIQIPTKLQREQPFRRIAWVLVLITIAALSADGAGKMNVLLMLADDLRDSVGCYGNTQAKTPNIDKLAQLGVRFEHAYVQYPVCNPSRTSFLTGLRCEQTRIVQNTTMFRSHLPDIVTLPQFLRQ